MMKLLATIINHAKPLPYSQKNLLIRNGRVCKSGSVYVAKDSGTPECVLVFKSHRMENCRVYRKKYCFVLNTESGILKYHHNFPHVSLNYLIPAQNHYNNNYATISIESC